MLFILKLREQNHERIDFEMSAHDNILFPFEIQFLQNNHIGPKITFSLYIVCISEIIAFF